MRSNASLALVLCSLAIARCSGAAPTAPVFEELVDEPTNLIAAIVTADVLDRILPALDQRAVAAELAIQVQGLQSAFDQDSPEAVSASIAVVRHQIDQASVSAPAGGD